MPFPWAYIGVLKSVLVVCLGRNLLLIRTFGGVLHCVSWGSRLFHSDGIVVLPLPALVLPGVRFEVISGGR